MKDVIKNIVGKTIQGVVVTKAHNANRMHVYLAFSDNTYFELWSPAAIAGGRQLESGGMAEIKKYARDQSIVQEGEGEGS